MNRKERRKAQREQGVCISRPVNVVAHLSMDDLIEKYPEIKNAIGNWERNIRLKVMNDTVQVLEMEKERTANETMALITSVFAIVLKELHDVPVEKVNQILEQILEQLDLCGQNLVTTDEIISLCKSYDIDVNACDEIMNRIGTKMQAKMMVFSALERGIIEIDELVEATGVEARECSSYRWEYNSKKYGVVDVTKQEKAFKLFEKGIFDVEHIAKKIESSKASVYQYKSNWKSQKKKAMTIDEFTDAIMGDDNIQEDSQQEEKKTIHKEIHTETEKPNTEPINKQIERAEQSNQVEEIEKDKAQEEAYGEVQVVEEVKESVQVIKKGFKSKKKTIELEGDFATYKIENKVVEFWGNAFEKEHLLGLIEELQAVVEEF